MSGTTSISDLPTGNQGGGSGNVQMHTSEANSMFQSKNERDQLDNSMASSKLPPPNPNEYMKQVVTDVQAASIGGGLQLPARDIPTETTHITQDQQIKSNYIPENTEDYIQKYQTTQEVIETNEKKEDSKDKLENLFYEFQAPILIFALYVVLQLPIVNKTIHSNLPMLFKNDGNSNMKGYLFNGALMASTYYGVTKGMDMIAV